jgi:hypothetical protein
MKATREGATEQDLWGRGTSSACRIGLFCYGAIRKRIFPLSSHLVFSILLTPDIFGKFP